MSEVENGEEIFSLELGYGNVLRNAREKQGLSLVDVCTELRLTEGVIYAIENQNIDKLPEPAYVCGYIRNYARYMQIDAEPLIENFKQSMPLKSKLSSTNSIGQTLEKKQEKKTVLFLFFLIILLVVGGFFAWQLWENKLANFFSTEIISNTFSTTIDTANKTTDTANKITDTAKEPAKDTATFTTSVLAQDSQTNTQSNTQIETIEEVVQANTDISANETSDSQISVENSGSEDKNDIKNVKTEQIETAELKQQQENSISEASVTEAVATIEKKTISSKKQMEFKFTKNSWISVKDGNNKSLIYDLIHKGELLKLSGKAPVNVFLGDGTGVELTVDEKIFDFKEHINSKNIAKFNIE